MEIMSRGLQIRVLGAQIGKTLEKHQKSCDHFASKISWYSQDGN